MQNLYLESVLMSFAETIRNEKEKISIVSEKWTVLHHLLSSRRGKCKTCIMQILAVIN